MLRYWAVGNGDSQLSVVRCRYKYGTPHEGATEMCLCSASAMLNGHLANEHSVSAGTLSTLP